MSDLIKRQDAQMAVQDHYNKDHGFRSYEDGQRMLNRINALPSAQKTGHWIQAEDIPTEYAVCTNCKGHGEFYMNYCWHCGSRMEREEE